MKKYFPSLLLCAVLFAGGAYAAEGIVFVDVQEVFKQFYKTKLAQDQIRQQAEDIKIEREAMESDMKELQEEVEALRVDSRDKTLSEELRESKRDQLEEKLVELQKTELEAIEFEKLRNQQIEQQNKRMTRKLFDEIHEAIIVYSKEKGFAGVIDRSAQGRSGMQTILYANPQRDITVNIVVALNEGHEGTLVQGETAEQ
ncbi:MAG: OmpH family outer membrane protein [Verrucomicrobiota bacterium]